MKLAALVALVAALAGCSSMPGLYAELGAGVVVDAQTSAVIRPECQTVTLNGGLRSCGGDNPSAQFNVGYEFAGRRSRCELAHWSHYFDGGADRELFLLEGRCIRRFGGRSL